MQEIAVQRQTMVRTLLRVKLCRKNIIARHSRCEATAVVGLAHGVARVRRFDVKTVDEVEIAAIRHIPPNGMGLTIRVRLHHLIPAHLRHLEPAAVGLHPPARARVGELWVEDARMEHASIVSFARAALELEAREPWSLLRELIGYYRYLLRGYPSEPGDPP